MQKIELERCYCGAVPVMENFISMKFGYLGKGQMTAFRVVCHSCDEGRFNLRGSPTREKAAAHWNDLIKSWKEVIREESEKLREPLTSEQQRDLVGWARENPGEAFDAIYHSKWMDKSDVYAFKELVASGSFKDYCAMDTLAREVYMSIIGKARRKKELQQISAVG